MQVFQASTLSLHHSITGINRCICLLGSTLTVRSDCNRNCTGHKRKPSCSNLLWVSRSGIQQLHCYSTQHGHTRLLGSEHHFGNRNTRLGPLHLAVLDHRSEHNFVPCLRYARLHVHRTLARSNRVLDLGQHRFQVGWIKLNSNVESSQSFVASVDTDRHRELGSNCLWRYWSSRHVPKINVANLNRLQITRYADRRKRSC
jgi:hypothetical protein